MALTATATGRVREDIVEQLHLKDPGVFVASFNRPNLTYRVAPKSSGYRQILDYLRARPRDGGIIYCASRAGTESLASKLVEDGIKAVPYHAGLDPRERSRNQEAFLRDETRVVCATIAFGMGINKPNVRFVIHHDLPKNLEGYYQETGRAGRDGLPGECLLLFSPGDVTKQNVFIEEKPDEDDRARAREQLQQMVHYAEIGECRRAALLDYFGEEFPESNCGACDNCLNPRATWDGTQSAQKLLSCVYRIRQKNGFAVGLNHVVAVLLGGDTEKVRQWGHDTLSTYGIGGEHSRSEWGAIARELMRLGFLRQAAGQFPTVEVTPLGFAALKDRRKIMLTRPMESAGIRVERVGEIGCDELLFEKLRQTRKRIADEKGVPSYIIFGDNSLRLMARQYPVTDHEFRRISGVGATKLESYGTEFMAEIAAHLQTNPRQIFADDSFKPVAASAARKTRGELMNDSVRETLRQYRAGVRLGQIATARELAESTITGHLASALEAGEAINLDQIISPGEQAEIQAAFEKAGWNTLSGAHSLLDGRIDYGRLRLFRAAQSRG